jgi:hypothetical protein
MKMPSFASANHSGTGCAPRDARLARYGPEVAMRALRASTAPYRHDAAAQTRVSARTTARPVASIRTGRRSRRRGRLGGAGGCCGSDWVVDNMAPPQRLVLAAAVSRTTGAQVWLPVGGDGRRRRGPGHPPKEERSGGIFPTAGPGTTGGRYLLGGSLPARVLAQEPDSRLVSGATSPATVIRTAVLPKPAGVHTSVSSRAVPSASRSSSRGRRRNPGRRWGMYSLVASGPSGEPVQHWHGGHAVDPEVFQDIGVEAALEHQRG